MTREFECLLNLFSIGSNDVGININLDGVDWNKLERLAEDQGISPIIGYALKITPEIACPEELRKVFINAMRSAGIRNTIRKSDICVLLQELATVGITAVVLKGFAAAEMYRMPECRGSSDVDLLIPADKEQQACDFMQAHGFSVTPRWKNGHHAVCHHPTMGCVELHVMLYDEMVEEIWFGKMDGNEYVSEPYQIVQSVDVSYTTLGYTDHLIFLTLHMVKHFILSGLSIRMMMDVALYYSKNVNKIDQRRFWRILRELRYNKLVSSVLWAMITYCGFHPNTFEGMERIDTEAIYMILDDLELGGCMGLHAKEEREQGWKVYNRRLITDQQSSFFYFVYMIKKRIRAAVGVLLTSKQHLKELYPFLKDRPWLIIYARFLWVIRKWRMVQENGRILNGVVSSKMDISEEGLRRIALFKKLDMMD